MASTTPIIDSYVTVKSVQANPTKGTVTVVLQQRYAVPRCTIRLSWMLPQATRDNSQRSLTCLAEKTGTVTYTLTGIPSKMGPYRVVLSLNVPRISESKSFTFMNSPSMYTTAFTVTGGYIVGGWVFQNAPGIAMSIAPSTRVTKWVGRAVLGWSLATTVQGSYQMNSCPAWKVGNYIVTTTYTTSANGQFSVWADQSVYSSFSAYKGRKNWVCHKTWVMASYK